MTIEEAIQHCKDEAHVLFQHSAKHRTGTEDSCYECAKEHEQLAEWLTELKQRREAEITAPPKSNGDRIRQMTDEELAYFLTTTSCSICCDHPLNCGFDCASLYTIKAEKTEQASLLDRLAAEYDRKHPNGLKFVYSLDGETQQTEQEEKENG